MSRSWLWLYVCMCVCSCMCICVCTHVLFKDGSQRNAPLCSHLSMQLNAPTRSPSGAIGHHDDLFVMRKHSPAHLPGDLNGQGDLHTSLELYNPDSGGENIGPPGTLQHRPDGHYWCEQRYGMVVHGREGEKMGQVLWTEAKRREEGSGLSGERAEPLTSSNTLESLPCTLSG